MTGFGIKNVEPLGSDVSVNCYWPTVYWFI